MILFTYYIYASSSKLVAIHLLTYVVRFIKMNLPFKFLLIWINDCGFIGSVGVFYPYVLFKVTAAMLDD